jgi:hypothetical protein
LAETDERPRPGGRRSAGGATDHTTYIVSDRDVRPDLAPVLADQKTEYWWIKIEVPLSAAGAPGAGTAGTITVGPGSDGGVSTSYFVQWEGITDRFEGPATWNRHITEGNAVIPPGSTTEVAL